jgi:hypothetical protein
MGGKVESENWAAVPLHLRQWQVETLPSRQAQAECTALHHRAERDIADKAEWDNCVAQCVGHAHIVWSGEQEQARIGLARQDAGEDVEDGRTVLVALGLEPA